MNTIKKKVLFRKKLKQRQPTQFDKNKMDILYYVSSLIENKVPKYVIAGEEFKMWCLKLTEQAKNKYLRRINFSQRNSFNYHNRRRR